MVNPLLDKKENEENASTFDTPDEAEPLPPSDIVSYNELRSCADLFRLFETGKLEIQPDFQREVVWKENDQSRFIDSLVKQLPIPSMCFGLDYNTQKWKVIDGLQRMSSIIKFLSPTPWRLKNLDDIHPSLRGMRNIDLAKENSGHRKLFDTVENVSIPITVLRCDYEKASHMNYLFTIFHRLNSGGTKLNNQEIRNCIYSGNLNTLLRDFDAKNSDWQSVRKSMWGSYKRFRSVELLLRVLAFSYSDDEYEGNLSKFLNDYMHRNMDMPIERLKEVEGALGDLANAARRCLSKTKGKVSLTYIEAALIGLFANLKIAEKLSESELTSRFDELVEELFARDLARYAVASEANVTQRIELATSVFS